MELETGTLEAVPEEPVQESLPEETEPETAGAELEETAAEILTEPETALEVFETEEPAEMETAVHGSPVSVSGNAVIFPEGYEYITAEYDAGDPGTVMEALDAQTRAIEAQTEAMREGFSVVCVALGVVIGIVLVQGFRLRRV